MGRTTSTRIAVAALCLGVVAGACTPGSDSGPAATQPETEVAFIEPIDLIGDTAGVGRWQPMVARPGLIYVKVGPGVSSSVMAVDSAGEPWTVLGSLRGDVEFVEQDDSVIVVDDGPNGTRRTQSVAIQGSSPLLLDAGDTVVTPVEPSAPADESAPGADDDAITLAIESIPGFVMRSSQLRPAAVSEDAWLLIGYLEDDPLVEGWFRRVTPPGGDNEERRVNEQHVMQLFRYEPASGDLARLSGEPAMFHSQTAVGESFGPEWVLDAKLLGGGLVAYTSGFSGAAYDIAYRLFIAPLP